MCAVAEWRYWMSVCGCSVDVLDWVCVVAVGCIGLGVWGCSVCIRLCVCGCSEVAYIIGVRVWLWRGGR